MINERLKEVLTEIEVRVVGVGGNASATKPADFTNGKNEGTHWLMDTFDGIAQIGSRFKDCPVV